MWLTGTGVIRYDPPRPGLKTRTKWWCVVDIDREITRYYRWWVKKELHIDLCQPSWDAHISIIRGEHPNDETLWKKYHGETVEFTYRHCPRQTSEKNYITAFTSPDCFWFVDVKSPKMKAIRDEFGFPSDWNFHLTFGRVWY